MTGRHRIAVVDDEPEVVAALERALRGLDVEVRPFTDPVDALERLIDDPVDLVICDLDMPRMHGLELLRRLRRHTDSVRIVLTGRASLESALDAINSGEVYRYITKPWDSGPLRDTVRQALALREEQRRVADLAEAVHARDALLAELEAAFPGLTRIDADADVHEIDAERIDALFSFDPGRERIDPSLPTEPAGGSDRARPEHEVVGTRVDGRYRLEALIGGGGFGLVYRATQLSLEREVAVKLLRSERATEHLERFRREALSACRVVHPNAVMTLDAGVDERVGAFLVMELLGGRTLAERLRDDGPAGCAEAAGIAADVCAALAAAHASGILHRDVKPGNVFLQDASVHGGPSGVVTKLLDFGIAKLMNDSLGRLTNEDEVIGTPAYMAPERIAGGTIDGRSDVYATGVMLYGALTGVNPFTGLQALEAAHQQVRLQPRALTAHDEAVPEAFDALVMRMIARDPEERPTADEAAAALRAMIPELPERPLRSVRRAALGATKTTVPS